MHRVRYEAEMVASRKSIKEALTQSKCSGTRYEDAARCHRALVRFVVVGRSSFLYYFSSEFRRDDTEAVCAQPPDKESADQSSPDAMAARRHSNERGQRCDCHARAPNLDLAADGGAKK